MATAPEGLWKTFAASTLVLLVGLVLLLQTTEGGSAFTTETLRRTSVDRQAQTIPAFTVKDSEGRIVELQQILGNDGRVRIVDFIYTRCQTVCTSQGAVFQRLQQQIVDRGLGRQVGLLSISFDPENDDAAALQTYAARMRADAATWRIVTLASTQDRRQLLDAFGIMVIATPRGEFEHNASLQIVDAHGMLIRIVDFDDIDLALDVAVVAAR